MSLKIKNLLAAAVVGAMALGSLANQASAAGVFFTGSGAVDGSTQKAEIDFDLIGSNLFVTLINTSTVSTSQPALLMGGYWNSASLTGAKLTFVSSNGSTILNGPAADAGYFGWVVGNVGGTNGTSGKFGVSTSSYGPVEPPNSPAINDFRRGLDGATPGNPNALDGPDGGLASTVGTSSGKTVLQNSVKYTLDISGVSGFNANTFLASINGIVFTYGTGSGDYVGITPTGPGTPRTTVPVPAAAWTGMALLAGMGVVRKFRKANRA